MLEEKSEVQGLQGLRIPNPVEEYNISDGAKQPQKVACYFGACLQAP